MFFSLGCFIHSRSTPKTPTACMHIHYRYINVCDRACRVDIDEEVPAAHMRHLDRPYTPPPEQQQEHRRMRTGLCGTTYTRALDTRAIRVHAERWNVRVYTSKERPSAPHSVPPTTHAQGRDKGDTLPLSLPLCLLHICIRIYKSYIMCYISYLGLR